MSRFFVDKTQISGTEIFITGDDVKHISRVLRLRIGDRITACDKCKTDYLCDISEINSDKVVLRIIEQQDNQAEPGIEITLYQGLPKSDKMDYIVQKCVELGVTRIVPVITKRAVSRPADGDKKIVRWQKIASEAAKQSGRGVIPVIDKMISFNEAISEMCLSDALNIMPYECERDGKLRDVLNGSTKTKINVFIGPEGGFDDSEADICRSKGIHTVSLGPRILRTETAPIAVCTAIMYELGDW